MWQNHAGSVSDEVDNSIRVRDRTSIVTQGCSDFVSKGLPPLSFERTIRSQIQVRNVFHDSLCTAFTEVNNYFLATSTASHQNLRRLHLPRGRNQGYFFSSQCAQDRKSTRLNSSHGYISYAVFCL